MNISIPMKLTDDIDKLNSSSDYYNDVCYTSKSKNGTDISLKDRQKEFVENDKAVCEENCEFTRYNYETGKAVCSCEVKIKLPLISEIKFDKNKLLDNFINIKSFANINIMKCYKKFLSIKGISKNYGCYIIIPIFIMHIICTFLFYLKDFKEIKNIIKDITFAKKNFPQLNKIFKKKSEKTNNSRINTFSSGRKGNNTIKLDKNYNNINFIKKN